MEAPEHASRVATLTERLSSEDRARLAFRWIDRGVREHVVAALIEARQGAAAEKLRALREIRDHETCRAGATTLTEVFRAGGLASGVDTAALACGASLGATIARHVKPSGPDIFWVAVGTVTAAGCAGFGAREMAAQIEDVERALAEP